MQNDTLKYLIIVGINLIVLSILLAIWTDKLELIFNDLVRPVEFLKIIGFTIVALIGIRILLYYFKKKNSHSTSTRIKTAILLTFMVSSYLYVDYSIRIVNTKIIHREFRNNLADKIQVYTEYPNGMRAENLTIQEYDLITEMNWFPKLPQEANNILFNYMYDNFLPDYSFILEYDLPIEIEVDTFHRNEGDFSTSNSFVIMGTKKRVTYNEMEQ